MSLEQWVESLASSSRTGKSVVALRRLEAEPASYGAWVPGIAPGVRAALERRGITQPYTHQSEAWEAVLAGRDVVIETPTASGKSLCYHAPIVSMVDGDADGTALLLYPTKALSQDQCAELNGLLGEAGVGEIAHVYDGDTPQEIRQRVRQSSRLVLTNPDMLHAAILPHHERWRRFLSRLRYVVVDEMHMYRGVFGSHVANVFRRLQRLCRHYGAEPRFVFTSATIANPTELAERLCARSPVVRVARSGAPRGARLVVFYNPPIVDAEQQRRQSPGSAAHRMVRGVVKDGHSAIVFARSRKGVELLTRRLRHSLKDDRHEGLAQRVTGYRGGYLPEERRRIERALRAGEIRAVITTNALELGIDIGSLDVCVIAGYPGTIASTWQQAGRAGRRNRTSVVVLVASDEPVDQYLMQHPEFFFEASPEHARIDPDNLRILAEHIKCAVFERPMRFDEGFGDLEVETTQEILQWLSEEAQLLVPQSGAWHWSADNYPATTVSLRDIPDENFVIVDTGGERPRVVGEIDFVAAHKTVHLNAIYQHDGQLYEVHRLDYPERKAWIRPVDPEYYTQAIDQSRVFVLDELEDRPGAAGAGWGEVRVATRFVGYKKLRFRTHENIGYGEIQLPDLERHTTSYWATFPSSLLSELPYDGVAIEGALQGIGRALHTVGVIHLMCDANDLVLTLGSGDGGAWTRVGDRPLLEALELAVPEPSVPVGGSLLADPMVFLYDRYPGGVGFSEKLFDLHERLLQEALSLIEGCACAAGCPACVGPPGDVTPGAKIAALGILRAVTATTSPA